MNWTIDVLIPQKIPFLFVDRVVRFEDKSVQTEFLVTEHSPFVEDSCLLEPGLVENMAQTAAALEGCLAKLGNGEIKLGFIGSVKRLEINEIVRTGDLLETHVRIVNNAMGVNIAEGEVTCRGRNIAKCELNIFLKQ